MEKLGSCLMAPVDFVSLLIGQQQQHTCSWWQPTIQMFNVLCVLLTCWGCYDSCHTILQHEAKERRETCGMGRIRILGPEAEGLWFFLEVWIVVGWCAGTQMEGLTYLS